MYIVVVGYKMLIVDCEYSKSAAKLK